MGGIWCIHLHARGVPSRKLVGEAGEGALAAASGSSRPWQALVPASAMAGDLQMDVSA
jgi:hypothetical protein